MNRYMGGDSQILVILVGWWYRTRCNSTNQIQRTGTDIDKGAGGGTINTKGDRWVHKEHKLHEGKKGIQMCKNTGNKSLQLQIVYNSNDTSFT